jgi:DNA-binding CsgD family transcriptional regulator/tetratricopeptide (TPR) repeat protein
MASSPPTPTRGASATHQPRLGGVLVVFGDALVGQRLAQPGMLVVHGSHPFLQLSRMDRCWLRMGRERAVRIWQVPYIRRWSVPYLWPLASPVAISLWSVAGDNPGEMGGRVASPTFVGRIEELELLEATRRRAADADPAVVLVGGEAGVGKTRLIAELAARGITDGNRVLTGGCMPVGDGALPYAPIVEILRSLLSQIGAGTVRELVGPSWPELARLLPSLGEPDRTILPDLAAQARLFELLLGLLGRLGEQAPLVVVVEDLHWADRSTRDLLVFLVRNLRRERLLLVISYRNDEPGQQQLGPYLAEMYRSGRVEHIELPRLDQVQTEAQLAGILEAAPAAGLVEAVFARSEGNPYFTEELLAVVRAGSGELPTTLRGLLRGRVQTLPDPAQQVLTVVAVAGRRVSHQLLAAVAGLDDEQLVGALRAGVAGQLLVTRPGREGYDVRHALLREVIDADLLPGERARLHAGLAQTLTEQPELADGLPAVAAAELAAHWDAAGEPTRALPASIQAGLAAERAHAYPEARRHYERALQLWERVRDPGSAGLDRVELLTRAATAAAFTGAVEHAVELVDDALGQVNADAEPVRAAVLLARLGDYRRAGGDEVGALAAFEQAELLLIGLPPSAERAWVLATHAYAQLVGLRAGEAVPRCEEAIAVAQAVGARAEEAKALRVLAGCMADLGDPDRSITLSLEARRIAEEIGDAETIIGTYVNLTFTLELAGREREAVQDGQQGYQRARELGLEHAAGSYVANNLAFSLLNTGRWTECEQLTQELLAGDRWGAFNLHEIRSALLTRQGDFAAAREHLELAHRLSPRFFEDWAWLWLAELALWEGRDDEAAEAISHGQRRLAQRDPDGTFAQRSSPWYPLALRLEADQAQRAAARRATKEVAEIRQRAAPIVAAVDRLAAARTPQARYPLVTSHLVLAQAEQSRLEGRSDPERWRTAAATWERLEYPFEAAYARFRLAEALLAGGSPRDQAAAALRPAHQTAVALGAMPLRREIELLAQRGRLRLEEPVDTTTARTAPPSPAAGLGLTQREAEVLALVAEGRTNRQIGQALFITPKTASIHVSRILAKLGVAGRGEAAAIAHRLGLDKQ